MKKLKFITVGLLSATLLLGACGQEEKQEAKDNKQEQKEIKKKYEDRKKLAKKKHDEKIKELKDKKEVINDSAKKVKTVGEDVQEQQPVQQEPQTEQPPVQEAPVEQQAPDQTLSNMNEDGEDNRNGYGEDTVSPGYEDQAEENQAYEEYKQGKVEQAQAGESALPGAGLMDLSDEE